uniref:NADH-ubiquinone oxidoreductase chain 2 n=1 Tax=Chelonarium sp. BMNH 840450 TaxID=1903803 RepID=A0A343A3I4_9COLE|nr:NADH dehydrogenase subunit 2 [Chelonarium sp. BMNH 840450]
MMFISSMIAGTVIASSSNTWMGMWIGLEINLLSIIPILTSINNSLSSEAAMKYFIIQAMASTALLMSMILMFKNLIISSHEMKSSIMMILNSSVLTKMGAAPFHFWFPEVMEGLNWLNCLIMLTWQKIAPMIIMSYNCKMTTFMVTIIISCMLISGIIGINQTSLRKILAFSSINHIGWMISSMMFTEKTWFFYFIIYSIITINIIVQLKNTNSFFINQMMSNKMNQTQKTMFLMNFMSLGGLPPFLGFFPKWLVIQMMVENNLISISIIMVMLTLMTLFFYMRMTFSSMTMGLSIMKWLPLNKIKWNISIIVNIIALAGLFLSPLLMT